MIARRLAHASSVLGFLLAISHPAEGQRASQLRVGAGGASEVERRRWAPVASLIVPGTGQVLLRQDRFMAYVALEAWSILEFANQRTEGRRQQNRYRSLARDVSRAVYGPPYPVGQWAYYESM